MRQGLRTPPETFERARVLLERGETVRYVADRVGYNEKTIRLWVHSGRLGEVLRERAARPEDEGRSLRNLLEGGTGGWRGQRQALAASLRKKIPPASPGEEAKLIAEWLAKNEVTKIPAAHAFDGSADARNSAFLIRTAASS